MWGGSWEIYCCPDMQCSDMAHWMQHLQQSLCLEMNTEENLSILSLYSPQCSAGTEPRRLDQELYSPAQNLAYKEDCGSSYCQPAGGTTRSRYACRCCASPARMGCSQGRSHRGRNMCAAPALPAASKGEQLSWPLVSSVSCPQEQCLLPV